MSFYITNTILHVENGAHAGAFGRNSIPEPTEGQCKAGNYKMGRITLYGLPIAIEQPRGTYRNGIDPKTGKQWSSRMAAHYGYFSGTKGKDGDGVDVFVGFYPQSEQAYVINQFVDGRFDEAKVMLAFPDEQSAKRAYLDSYERGWKGLESIIPLSISQLKWWLKNGDMSKPLRLQNLPPEGLEMSKRVYWNNETALPHDQSLATVLYDIRRSKNGELLLDSVSVQDIIEDSEGVLLFDAMVTPYAKLQRKMEVLQGVMERTSATVKPVSMQITDPFKQRGVANVAVVFELSDGQTASIFLHNPDVTPNKIAPTDELISWKWLLNKKGITIVVAPERGEDLNVREVARRIMKLAEKNSAAFARANTKRTEHMQNIQSLKDEIVSLEKELADAQHELEIAKVEAENRAPTPSRQSQLERQAEEFGPNRDGFYGVISDGQDLPDDFMPNKENRQMDMAMKEIAKESGQSFVIQVNANKDKPFRVIKTLVDPGSEIGSQWGETPEQAYNMLPGPDTAGDEQDPAITRGQEIRRVLVAMGYELGADASHQLLKRDGDTTVSVQNPSENNALINDVFNITVLVNGMQEYDVTVNDDPSKSPEEIASLIDEEGKKRYEANESQNDLPWTGASAEDESRWFGTIIKLTAKDRELAEKGLVREGEATLQLVKNSGNALEVKWPDQDFMVRVNASNTYDVEVVKLVDKKILMHQLKANR